MKTGFLLMLLPVLFLVSTGFIYANYQSWNTSCAGYVACQTSVSSNVSTNNPLFALIVGNYAGMFSSLQVLIFGNTPYTFTVPWFALTTYSVGLPSFYVPDIIPTTSSLGGYKITIPNFIGGSFPVTVPSITVPWITIGTYYITLPSMTIPWITTVNAGFQISLPSPTFATLSFIVGSIMIFLGLGIGVTLLGSGFSVNEAGSRTLTVIGTGVVLWTFISVFTGAWLLSIDFGWGNIIMGFLELMFIVGLYSHISQGD